MNNEMLSQIQKTRDYLDYIEEHYLNVQKAWKELSDKCSDMRFIYDDYVFFSIDGEIKQHDLSKLSEEEFIQYRKAFYPTTLEIEQGKYDVITATAWDHHKVNNGHHFENWTAKDYCNPYEWEVNCAHMIADWMAMGYKFNVTAQQFYEIEKEKINLPDYAEKFIYEIFNRLSKKAGE